MATAMQQISATADAHVRRDTALVGKWICECPPCVEMRSLIGMDKLFEIRPLVREIRELEDRLRGTAEGAERQSLRERYLACYDQLAAVMAQKLPGQGLGS